MISFLVPYRDREEHLANLTINLKSHYHDCEIIIGEQADDTPFKKGQLLNVLSRYATNDLLVFVDVDCRIIDKIHFQKLMDEFKVPYLPWFYRQEYEEHGPNSFEKLKGERYSNGGWGGICCFSKQQYKDSCGCSNLCSGWGAEDSIMFLRTDHRRIKNDLVHIKHRSRPLEFNRDNNKSKAVKHNRSIWKMTQKKTIDPTEDGIDQTIAEVSEVCSTLPNTRHLKISNFSVPQNYKYRNLLP